MLDVGTEEEMVMIAKFLVSELYTYISGQLDFYDFIRIREFVTGVGGDIEGKVRIYIPFICPYNIQ